MIRQIKKNIEKEFEKVFFLPITFGKTKKMIIAPREYFKKMTAKEKKEYSLDIDFGYFRDKNFSSHEPKDLINSYLVR